MHIQFVSVLLGIIQVAISNNGVKRGGCALIDAVQQRIGDFKLGLMIEFYLARVGAAVGFLVINGWVNLCKNANVLICKFYLIACAKRETLVAVSRNGARKSITAREEALAGGGSMAVKVGASEGYITRLFAHTVFAFQQYVRTSHFGGQQTFGHSLRCPR